jgi:hypothetical protein
MGFELKNLLHPKLSSTNTLIASQLIPLGHADVSAFPWIFA